MVSLIDCEPVTSVERLLIYDFTSTFPLHGHLLGRRDLLRAMPPRTVAKNGLSNMTVCLPDKKCKRIRNLQNQLVPSNVDRTRMEFLILL